MFFLNLVLILWRFAFGSFPGLAQAIALSIGFQDVATMCEPIQEGDGEPFGTKDFSPFLEGEVGGDHEALLLVCPANHLEEEFGAGLGERHIAQLIEEQEMKELPLFVEALEASFLPELQ